MDDRADDLIKAIDDQIDTIRDRWHSTPPQPSELVTPDELKRISQEITREYLRPELERIGVENPEQYFAGYDMSPLASVPRDIPEVPPFDIRGYVQFGPEPADDDPTLGCIDSEYGDLVPTIVKALNALPRCEVCGVPIIFESGYEFGHDCQAWG